MAEVIEVVKWFFANYGDLILNVEGVLVALIALFMIIPGPSPERELQAVVDFIKRFSRK